MVATAVKLAQERGAAVVAIHVIRVPLDQPLDARALDEEERAAESLAEATALGADHGVKVEGRVDPRALDRRGDRPGGRGDRRRPDRARLVAALAPPVALLLADGRLRPAQGARRGARRRLPAGRARRGLASYAPRRAWTCLKALVIGCGRVGSAIALQLHQEGWDVTVVDENEDALSRLGENWPGRVHRRARHGRRPPARGRASRTPTQSSSRPTATTRTSSSARSRRSASTSAASSCACSTPPARSSTRSGASTRSARRSVAIDALMDAARTCAIPTRAEPKRCG